MSEMADEDHPNVTESLDGSTVAAQADEAPFAEDVNMMNVTSTLQVYGSLDRFVSADAFPFVNLYGEERLEGSFDWFTGTKCEKAFVARNQGGCGSCYAFASATALTLSLCKAALDAGLEYTAPVHFSHQHVVSCAGKLKPEDDPSLDYEFGKYLNMGTSNDNGNAGTVGDYPDSSASLPGQNTADGKVGYDNQFYGKSFPSSGGYPTRMQLGSPYVGGCNGGNFLGFTAFMRDYGVTYDACFPYTSGGGSWKDHWDSKTVAPPVCPTTCTPSFYKTFPKLAGTLPKMKIKPNEIYRFRGEYNMKMAIKKYGAIYVSMVVKPDFDKCGSDPNCVYQWDKQGGAGGGGHALVVYGWGVSSTGMPYWKIINSWGSSWGYGGKSFYKIRRGYNEVGIEEGAWAAVVDGAPGAGNLPASEFIPKWEPRAHSGACMALEPAHNAQAMGGLCLAMFNPSGKCGELVSQDTIMGAEKCVFFGSSSKAVAESGAKSLSSTAEGEDSIYGEESSHNASVSAMGSETTGSDGATPGWRCGNMGDLLACPSGTVVTGYCRPGYSLFAVLNQNLAAVKYECTEKGYCNANGPHYQGVKCSSMSELSATGATVSSGSWRTGVTTKESTPNAFVSAKDECGAGEVMCGACQGGSCGGPTLHGFPYNRVNGALRLKCCSVSGVPAPSTPTPAPAPSTPTPAPAPSTPTPAPAVPRDCDAAGGCIDGTWLNGHGHNCKALRDSNAGQPDWTDTAGTKAADACCQYCPAPSVAPGQNGPETDQGTCKPWCYSWVAASWETRCKRWACNTCYPCISAKPKETGMCKSWCAGAATAGRKTWPELCDRPDKQCEECSQCAGMRPSATSATTLVVAEDDEPVAHKTVPSHNKARALQPDDIDLAAEREEEELADDLHEMAGGDY